MCGTDFRCHLGFFFSSSSSQKKATKAQLELTDLKNVEEPQSEDLKPLVCTKSITAKQSETVNARVGKLFDWWVLK